MWLLGGFSAHVTCLYALGSVSVGQPDSGPLKVEATGCADEVQRRDCKVTSDVGLKS